MKILKERKIYLEKRKEYYKRTKEKNLSYAKQYRKDNKEKIKEYQKKWYELNKKKILIKSKNYRKDNKEKIKLYWDLYYNSKEKHHWNLIGAKKRADKIKATPQWANLKKIKEIYKNCPKGYHVDHIIPLKGKYVCGLHVENNLQYLTAKENIKKGNRYIDKTI
jgi:hypothetical protein